MAALELSGAEPAQVFAEIEERLTELVQTFSSGSTRPCRW